MTDTCAQCPKCGYKPPQPLSASASCPVCGIYFFKWGHPENVHVLPEIGDASPPDAEHIPLATLLQPLEQMDAVTFYGRCAALILLLIWSWFLFGYDYRHGEINLSFMHDILLPIHEAGHVLFRPFGEFMMILGGSLFQLALPFGIGVSFIVKNRDNFGAAVGLWLTSVSLVDLSPYVYDALHPQLTLIGGGTGADGPHDWIYLLTTLGQLHNAQHWGAFVHVIGGFLMLGALVWGAAILWQQYEQLSIDIVDT
jgi:hypothetical protein